MENYSSIDLLDKRIDVLIKLHSSVLLTRGLPSDWTCPIRVVHSPHDGVLLFYDNVLILSMPVILSRIIAHLCHNTRVLFSAQGVRRRA